MTDLKRIRGNLLYDDFLKAQQIYCDAELAGYAPTMVWALLYRAGKEEGSAHQRGRAKAAYDALHELKASMQKVDPSKPENKVSASK